MSRISMFIRHKSTHINKLNFIEKSKARKSKQLHSKLSKLSKLERVSLQSSRVVGWYWYLAVVPKCVLITEVTAHLHLQLLELPVIEWFVPLYRLA